MKLLMSHAGIRKRTKELDRKSIDISVILQLTSQQFPLKTQFKYLICLLGFAKYIVALYSACFIVSSAYSLYCWVFIFQLTILLTLRCHRYSILWSKFVYELNDNAKPRSQDFVRCKTQQITRRWQ